ncbi:MAG: hypothetical protein FWK04_32875 [Nostoc sp. GBBB01]|nr:hypothetical protein [Nostoc sp. GBBB01]
MIIFCCSGTGRVLLVDGAIAAISPVCSCEAFCLRT